MMADWILLLLLAALGLGGYWLMGQVDRFLARNLTRNADPARLVEGWTPGAFRYIIGKSRKKEGRVHGSDANAASAPHGCAG